MSLKRSRQVPAIKQERTLKTEISPSVVLRDELEDELDEKPRTENNDVLPQIIPPAKKARKSKASESVEGKGKTQWSREEDEILLGLMDQLIKTALWPLIKADKRLVHRTSYGCQYHAKMLLSRGTGKK